MRRLVLVEVDAATPLEAEIIVGQGLRYAWGNPYVRQTNVIVAEKAIEHTCRLEFSAFHGADELGGVQCRCGKQWRVTYRGEKR